MKKFITISVVALLAIGLVASSAMALNEQGNTAQGTKVGSMLIFPKIDTRSDFDPLTDITYERDTFITIGNYLDSPVTLECIWKYPNIGFTDKTDASRADQLFPTQPAAYREYDQKCCGEENFTITLTPQQVVYFSAGTGLANLLGADLFDTINPIPAAAQGVSALTCFAVKSSGNKTPISHNGVYGEAKIIRFDNLGDNGISSWDYNAWAFKAKKDKGATMGVKGVDGDITLPLTGVKGGYDACPNLLTFNFIARQSFPGSLDTPLLGTDITLYPCTQDLREVVPVGQTKNETKTLAAFQIWNANEDNFSGTKACVKCWFEQVLGVTDKGRAYRQAAPGGFSPDPADLAGTNFGYRLPNILDAFQFVAGDNFIFLPPQGGLGTLFARARIDTVAATLDGTLCDATTIKSPLVGVLFDFMDLNSEDGTLEPEGTPEATSGRNMTGVGAEAAAIRFYPKN